MEKFGLFNKMKRLLKIDKSEEIIVIAGPCSAENEDQVLQTAKILSDSGKVKIFRAGIWKPRTRPGNFEGVGEKGLQWLKKVKEQTDLLTCTEVATTEHLETVLKQRDAVDIIWIGARTTANPFSVQALADALKGVNIPVMVKNPLNPDMKLWSGAIERIMKAGIEETAAIHRGFTPFQDMKLRNLPKWELAIEIKSEFPNMPVINDPSHIAGSREYIQEIAQKALNLNFDGLMIETHIDPDNALSDVKQQLKPEVFLHMLQSLRIRKSFSNDSEFSDLLEQYREQIDSIDFQLLELLNKRMEIVKDIGEYKLKNNVSIFQLKRWLNINSTRSEFGTSIGLDEKFIKRLLTLVHRESIRNQSEIMYKDKSE